MKSHEQTPLQPLLLPAKDAAALLQISRSLLYSLHSEGRLPAPIRLGRRVMWRREELQAWRRRAAPTARSGTNRGTRLDERADDGQCEGDRTRQATPPAAGIGKENHVKITKSGKKYGIDFRWHYGRVRMVG